MNVSGARSIILNAHSTKERERERFYNLASCINNVVSDDAATSPSMNWKIFWWRKHWINTVAFFRNRTEVLLDLPRGGVETIRDTTLQKQDQNTTRMLIFRMLHDDECHITINANLCERTNNSAGVKGQACLAEVFFILMLARIPVNRIGWVFMQSQIIFLLRLIGAAVFSKRASPKTEPARLMSSAP